ncbi:MAG: hypothetical protein MJ214_00335 [Bacilli bacterium]|nr:hypothetical protein [Bacilli bacterium]
MKNISRIITLLFVPTLFLTSCNGGGSNVKSYQISFIGSGVKFDKDSDTVTYGKDYTIGATPLDGYALTKDDFTIEVGNVPQSESLWDWSDNVLTIKGTVFKNDVKVTASADIVSFKANITASAGVTVGPYDHTVSLEKGFEVNVSANANMSLKVNLKINGEPSTKYTLNSNNGTNIEYTFKIKSEDITGDIDAYFYAIENDITVSTTALSFTTYATDAITYSLPSSITSITAESHDTTLFTVDPDYTNKIIRINSNLNNKTGSDYIQFRSAGGLLPTTVSVTIANPINIDEAHDALALASIRCQEGTQFKITFDFNNTLNEDDFELSQEIYGRMLATNFVTYSTGNNKINIFSVTKNNATPTLSSEMTPGDRYYYYNANNINYLNCALTSPIPHTLYIDTVNKTLAVDNSDELFWAVEHGYNPIIDPSKTSLIAIYNAARDICSEFVDPNLTDFEKFRIIFEELETRTHYDNWVIEQRDYWFYHKAYFLEGVFADEGKAVCDGFSKAYALLCGIEGLPCIRSYGFAGDSGHAWNYIKLEGRWYLACPTWCKASLKAYFVNFMDYGAFATSRDYFAKYEAPFSDLAFTTYDKSTEPYCSTSILSLDNPSYLISSDEDASRINQVVLDKIVEGQENYVCVVYKSSDASKKSRWENIITSGVAGFDIYNIGRTSTTETYSYMWLYFR